MDALIIIVLAVLVVIGAFFFLGIGRPRNVRMKTPPRTKGAYSKRSRHKT
ncbi:hypothetical protein [Desulfoplanes sp.]